MEKGEFISKIAKRSDLKSDTIEQIVDATLAEVVSPAVFVQAGERRVLLADNNCGNNCAAEIAKQQPVRGY